MDKTKREFRAIVKIFPPGTYGVLNESHGFIFHAHRGIPVAPGGYIIMIPVRKLRKYHPEVDWLKDIDEALWPAWATEEIPASGQKRLWEETLPSAMKDWPQLIDAIVAREAMHDIDGHPRNYLAMKDGSFCAIDFAESYGGVAAIIEDLLSLDYLDNRLLYDTIGLPSEQTRLILIRAYEKNMAAFVTAEVEMNAWTKRMITDQHHRDIRQRFMLRRASPSYAIGRWR